MKNPQKSYWELNWQYHRKLLRQDGVDIMQEDWDNLIILDACRYDIFLKENIIEGEVSSKISKGSNTPEFLNRNFTEEKYNDTIYTSANPQVQSNDIDKKFVDRIRLWETHWNEELRTVHPKDVSEESLNIVEKYPYKRHIIHYIQPHYPFIGEQGREIEHGSITGDGVISNERDQASVWTKLEQGELSKETVWNAYIENLELTLPYVQTLVNKLDGRTVVTSDHGNALGKKGIYGHPGRHFMDELVKVPWLTQSDNQRRKIKTDKIQTARSTDAVVKDRLSDLGYTE